MRSKREPNIQVKCDHCGEQTETFVATADYLLFCRIQTVGKPPEKDCMTDYYRNKNVRTKQIHKEDDRKIEEKSEIKKEKKEEIIKKFDDYLFELKQKSRRQRAD